MTYILTDEEIAISFTKGFEECKVPSFRPPSLSREIKLRQKAGDKAVAQSLYFVSAESKLRKTEHQPTALTAGFTYRLTSHAIMFDL